MTQPLPLPSTLASTLAAAADEPLRVGGMTLASRLVVGTGKYASHAEMQACLEASGTDCVTVAVRRERLINAAGENILDHIQNTGLWALLNKAVNKTAVKEMIEAAAPPPGVRYTTFKDLAWRRGKV